MKILLILPFSPSQVTHSCLEKPGALTWSHSGSPVRGPSGEELRPPVSSQAATEAVVEVDPQPSLDLQLTFHVPETEPPGPVTPHASPPETVR